ncbi:fasciclin-3-like [Uranotaenia lowii]|uniref:fasciclin-3-like n=1 Tax=Uranotaenia lowii TaxID=190385 RepID=UPI00247884B5|nr:fasciclin-3-like [Uranotaenia lowii]XP_055595332.1 fasciclin-3-like [Uranotaenia lowii]
MSRLVILSVVILASTGFSSALQVLTFPRTATVAENQKNVNLLCKIPGGESIDFCIVNVPGVKAPFASSDRLPTPVEGIKFYGEGWSKGSCGVTLDSIKPEHDGTFECSVSIKGQLYKGSIDIVVQVAPEPPKIEVSSNVDNSNGELDFGKPLTVRCISRNGWPGAKLSWYLDSTPVTTDLGGPFSETFNRRTTVQQYFRKPITVEDNRKRLICRAEHVAYPNGFMEVELPIKLRKSNGNENAIRVDETKVVPVKPTLPKLLVSSSTQTKDGAFRVGSDMVVQCISRDGKPAASFLWFLDDQLIYEGLSVPFLSSSFGRTTVQQVLQRKVLPGDNGKTLICKVRHPTGTSETRLKIATFN